MSEHAELGELLSAMAEGTLDDAGRRRLAELLRDDADARAFYRRYLRVHLLMEVESAGGGRGAQAMRLSGVRMAGSDAEADPDLRPWRPQVRLGASRWALRAYAIAAAVLVAGAAAAVYVAVIGGGDRPIERPDGAGPAVAVMLDAAGVSWTSEPIAPGESVDARPLEIGGGRIDLETLDGTAMQVTGPAKVALVDRDRVRLWRGNLSARSVPGFTVELDDGVRVIDLGTAFDVDVADDGRALVHVTEGRVRIERPGEAGYEMTAGAAAVVVEGVARGLVRGGASPGRVTTGDAALAVRRGDLLESAVSGESSAGIAGFDSNPPLAALRDGEATDVKSTVGRIMAAKGDSVTWTLDTAAAPEGYDIAAVESISSWVDRRAGQAYTVRVALVRRPDRFVDLCTVRESSDGGTMRVTMGDATAGDAPPLARGVGAIRIEFADGALGKCAYREFDVIGSPSAFGVAGERPADASRWGGSSGGNGSDRP